MKNYIERNILNSLYISNKVFVVEKITKDNLISYFANIDGFEIAIPKGMYDEMYLSNKYDVLHDIEYKYLDDNYKTQTEYKILKGGKEYEINENQSD